MSPRPDRRVTAAIAVVSFAMVPACERGDTGPDVSVVGHDADTADTADAAVPTQRFPDVLDAVAAFDAGTGTWTFEVTMSSPYDSPDRYADGWRVVGADGTVYGMHTLTHDHASEQPFTRRQTGVRIPADVTEITVEGRDLANGFGGGSVTIPLGPR